MNTESHQRNDEIRELAIELLTRANGILVTARSAADFDERRGLVKAALRKSREADGLMNEARSFGDR